MISKSNRFCDGLSLIEVMVGLVILQIGLVALLYGVGAITKDAVDQDKFVTAGYLSNYLLGEIIAKEYRDVYDPDTTGRGLNDQWDDLGYDRTPLDSFDTDILDIHGIAPDSFSNNDGLRNEPSFGEGDGILSRREWDDVDDYHGFVWGPEFDDEWGRKLSGDYRDFLVNVTVESLPKGEMAGDPIPWDASTGVKQVSVAVLYRGDTIVEETAVKLESRQP